MACYRLEHISGYGPYQARTQNRISVLDRHRYKPCPTEDLDPEDLDKFMTGKYFCACPSLVELARWFMDILDLISDEYKVFEIESEDVLFGEFHQCFNIDTVTKKTEIDFGKFYDLALSELNYTE